MSTRAIVRIRQKKSVRYFYHQCDGYPEYVGKDLQRMLDGMKKWNLVKIEDKLLSGILHVFSGDYKIIDSEYQTVGGPCGWEEYGYDIDCDNRMFVGYYFGTHNMPNEPIGDDWSMCEKLRPGEPAKDDTDMEEEMKNRDLINICTNIRVKDAESIGQAPLPVAVNRIYLLFGCHDSCHCHGSVDITKPLTSWSELLCAIRDHIEMKRGLCDKWLDQEAIDDLCFIWIRITADGCASTDIDFSHVVGACKRIGKGRLWEYRD